MKTKQCALSCLLICDLTLAVCAWSESVSKEMVVAAYVTKSCRISTKHELTAAGLIQNEGWFRPTAADNRAGLCRTGALPQIVMEPKNHLPTINTDPLNGLPDQSGHVIYTEVIFTDTPAGLGAQVMHHVLDIPNNNKSRRISGIGAPDESKDSGDDHATLKITIHF